MQLLAIILYSTDGARRVVDFKPGALNVITGHSATGKSTLLDIFEYCTGRKTVLFPLGPMTDAVSWYAALFQMSKTRAFVARPAPGPGRKTTNRVMLKLGADLEALPYEDLAANTDRHTLRQQLSQIIGIAENHNHDTHGQDGIGTEAHLGHATLLCLQGQSEIADSNRLFHRQSDHHVAFALKQTLPYFLGAAPHDQARKHAQFTAARRRLKQAENNLSQAQRTNDTAQETLAALWHEAHALSLVSSPTPPDDHVQALETLHDAVQSRAEMPSAEYESQRTLELEQTCADLRDQLRTLAADRRLLLAETAAADDYSAAARIPRDRLASLGLIPSPADDDATTCVLCGSTLPEPDLTVATLRHSLHRLDRQLDGIDSIRPARRAALEAIEQRTARLRSQLNAAEHALQALAEGEAASGRLPYTDRSDFVRGRIHGMLTALQRNSGADLTRLRRARDTARAAVEALKSELDPEAERDQLLARLVPISRDITLWAHELQLEHGDGGVHLNLSRLTVEFDTQEGRHPLSRVGSGQNWVGYHVLSHLALHRYFVRQRRPVPRILFLDQPSQAWYASMTHDGDEQGHKDHLAAERLFRLIQEVVQELAPELQVIVCDHVNLPAPWFQETVVQNWRDSEKLVPAHWMDTTSPRSTHPEA
ncbi:DUF3732 domain-containing protein [Streptomyces sp. Rer75]|uniref:DUF3732 domain-containing protein n=1 Tax=Streptomyces sp. Rer75 TaxID=2750011 RepID=UPI0015D08151|nr:DUF3732 domain-containing protein [Streptomyces sp. Rer75]QLH19292.1 DUF3732 domain-containing protein [Streptomyces sp. Rer75]